MDNNNDLMDYVDPRVVIQKFKAITAGKSLRETAGLLDINYTSVRNIRIDKDLIMPTYIKVLRFVLQYERGINIPL